jgi:hypothetical protein
MFAALLATALFVPVGAHAQEPGATLTAAAPEGETDEAAEDDILEVLDLPLVAVELADESGVAQAEIVGALEVAEEGGLTAAEAAEILEGERQGVRSRGKKRNFHAWLRRKIAKGENPAVIMKIIVERDHEEKLSDEDKAKMVEAIAAYKKAHKEKKQAVRARRKAYKAEGKVLKLRGVERHREREAKLARMRVKQLKRLKAAGAKHPDLDARLAAAKKRAGKAKRKEQRAEDRRKDAAGEMREDRADAREETLEAKDARKDAKADRKEAKAALRDAGVKPPKAKAPKDKKGKKPKDKLKDKPGKPNKPMPGNPPKGKKAAK